MAGYDVLGNIAIVKFKRGAKKNEKIRFAKKILGDYKSVKTVLEKSRKFHGRLRTLSTKYVLGEKTKEALYRENGCEFRFNVETCYFSPRLANERMEIAKMVGKGESVLVLFAGVAPFSIVIAKTGKPSRVVSVELGKDCSKYALENVKRNKVNVEVFQGDVRRVLPKMNENTKKSSIFGASKTKRFEGFDRIVMARPNLKDDFLDVSFPRCKKGGMIYYYGFYLESDVDKMREMIVQRAKEAGRKIRILKIKEAGDIGVKKYRYRVDIKLEN